MGCASSSPLVASGKNLIENAKESAGEFAHKGEHAIQDVGESAKEGFTTGVGHVKEAMGSALETVEHSLGTAVGKIGDTFSHTKSDVKETVDGLEDVTEENMHQTHDSMVEAVSEAETVLASEAENASEVVSHHVDDAKKKMEDSAAEAKEALSHTKDMAFEKVDMIKDDFKHGMKEHKDNVHDALKIEDMEQSLDMIENDISDAETRVENIVKRLPTPAPSPPPEVEAKKEEPPTFWEAAADAILEQRMQSLDIEVPESDLAVEPGPEHPEQDLKLEDLELDMEKPRAEDHLGEPCENLEKISVKSFILSEH